jgi:hypothetical protein
MIDGAKFLELLDMLACRGIIGEPESYSGRAMYGKRCVCVMGDEITEWGLALQLAAIAPDFDVDVYDIPEPTTDSMGRSFVMYWPRLEWPADRQCPSLTPDEEDEED